MPWIAWVALILVTSCSTVSDYYDSAAGTLKDEWQERLDRNKAAAKERTENEALKDKPVSLLVHQATLEADANLKDLAVELPKERSNKSWPYQQVPPTEHPSLPKTFTSKEIVEIGVEAGQGLRLTSTPLIAKGVIYTLDGKGKIRTFSLANPSQELWNAYIKSADKNRYLGGNIAIGDGKLIVTTIQGDVLALSLDNGSLIWEKQLQIAIKSAPMLYQGNIFVMTSNSQIIGLDGDDGSILWVHRGVPSNTQAYGTPTPVAMEGVVVAAYPSGELYSIKSMNGETIWRELLSQNTGSQRFQLLNDSDATPAIQRNGVFVGGDSVRGYNLYTGQEWWQRSIQSNKTPWVAGDFLYVMSDDNELACLAVDSGRIKWVVKLPEGKWGAPVLAGGLIRTVAANGKLASISPFNGEAVEVVDVINHVYLPPIVAENTLILLSNEGEIQVLK